MRKANLLVRLYAPKEARFCRLRAYVSKGTAVKRKYILSDIAAPGNELSKFVPNGMLAPGEVAPEWLQKGIQEFYKAAQEVAQAFDVTGKLKETPSKDLTERVRALLQSRGEVKPIEERG